MTGGQGYGVLTGELISHAGKVEGLGERMATAVAAARQVAMDDSAYGVICQPFAILLQPFEDMGVRALEKAAEAIGQSAGKVRSAVQKYEDMESGGIDSFKPIEGDLA